MKNSRLKIFFLMLPLLAAALPLYAQIVPDQLNTLAKSIQDVFTGPIVRIICVCSLAGCGIAYAFNKDNEKMKRNIIAIAVGTAIIIAASGVVETIGTASGGWGG